MAKKQSAPENILKQFEKPQFREGDAVFFVWLGSKKYGYVTTFKKVNWGIQYTVESEGVRYPCGIEIKTYKTTYTTGCIRFDETRSLGQEELVTRIQTGHPSTYSELFVNTPRPNNESRSNVATSKRVSTKHSNGTKTTGTKSKTADVAKSSAKGVRRDNTKKRGNNELDEAIEKQRNFLNGFVKKD